MSIELEAVYRQTHVRHPNEQTLIIDHFLKGTKKIDWNQVCCNQMPYAAHLLIKKAVML